MITLCERAQLDRMMRRADVMAQRIASDFVMVRHPSEQEAECESCHGLVHMLVVKSGENGIVKICAPCAEWWPS